METARAHKRAIRRIGQVASAIADAVGRVKAAA
jgi:hypothetical protein